MLELIKANLGIILATAGAVVAAAGGILGSAIGVGISCIIIGVIIGSVNMTSLGLNFGNLILRVVGDGHLFLGGLMVIGQPLPALSG